MSLAPHRRPQQGVAVPVRLRDPARGRLPAARRRQAATLTDAENGVEFFYLRPRDIALYVGEGTLDVGITGRDLLRDSGAKAEEVLALGFGRSRFRFAGPAGRYTDLDELAGTRIATSYVGVVRAFLEERGIEARWSGWTARSRPAIQLGVADVIADVVETGSTLRQAGLEIFGETILESEAVLITRAGDVPRRASRSSGAGSRASWWPGPT